ncbi:MAG: hypothetical protein IT454_08940 [Planctomycetes bacterium]|nr:hypothetical protein [Planctomycetota bacterium]
MAGWGASVVRGEPTADAPFADPRRVGRCRGWCERDLESELAAPDRALERIFALVPRRPLRVIPGRATFAWPSDASLIVKRYERGARGDAWHDWFHIGRMRTPGRREAENLRELAQCGLNVPRALGWCEEVRGRSWLRRRRSALWMEAVEHRATLARELANDPRRALERFGAELASSTARMHGLGWYHRDLYLEHWLVTERGLVLVDVGRARREARPRRRWFVKDIAALESSCPAGVAARARLRFLARYLDLRRISDRAQRRAFARDVLAKARAIRAHVPRHVDASSQA